MSGDGDFFCCKVYAKAKVPSATSSGETSVPYRWLDLYSNSTALYANCLTNYYYGAYNALRADALKKTMPCHNLAGAGF